MDHHSRPLDNAGQRNISSSRSGTPMLLSGSGSGSDVSGTQITPNKLKKVFFSKVKQKIKGITQPRVENASGGDASRDRLTPIAQTERARTSASALHGEAQANTHDQLPQVATSTGSAMSPRVARLEEIAAQQGNSPRSVPSEWTLDEDFLVALLIWDRDHPQDTLSKIFAKINDAIKKADPFMDIIPDSPFPARSLIVGLSHILQLGASLTSADEKLCNFALDVVEWISGLKARIASFSDDDFSKVSWGDLANVCKIIDKLCDWAKSRLADKRWTKFDMDTEIKEFEILIQKARQTFIDLTLLTISGNISQLRKVLNEIEKGRKAHKNKIAEERQRSEALHRELGPHTVVNPTYDVQAKYPCEAGSRTKVLADIREWIHDHSASSQNFLWLTGDPGCGKSAVTASIAREAKEQRFLWAQFFINRNLEQTTNPHMYFPTIARQLSDKSIKVERRVHDNVMETQSLLDHISTDQAIELFVSAISQASKVTPNAPVLVVIDGLDETNQAHLYATATIFSNLFNLLSDYPNAKILISSRTEHKIHKPFTRTLTNEHVRQVHLDTQDPSCLADVQNYIRKQLTQIAAKHDLDPLWPGQELEARLIDRAAGLYIWAVTAMKFVDLRLEKQGKENLYGLLEVLKLPKRGDINLLYSRILEVTYDNDNDETTEWDLESFRRIMGAIAISREPLSVSQLRDLIDLRRAPSSLDVVDVHNFVQLLRTVLVSGSDTVTDDTMVRVHKSFFEFITIAAEDRFRVSVESANAEMTLCCLQHLARSYNVVASTQFATQSSDVRSLSHSTRYALRYCASHLPLGRGVILDNFKMQALPRFNPLVPPLSKTLPLIMSYQDGPSVITTSLHSMSLLWNVDDGSSTTPTPISSVNAWNICIPGDGRSIYWLTGSTHLCIDADTFQVTSTQHLPLSSLSKKKPCTVSLSPDGTIYAITPDASYSPAGIEADNRNRIILWDTQTWEKIDEFQPNRPLEYWNSRLVFSHDTAHIIFHTDSGIEIWNFRTKLSVCEIATVALDVNLGVTLSPDDALILCATKETHSLLLWDFNTGQQVGTPFTGHTESVWSMAFSRDSKYIVSTSRDWTVRVWDTETHMQLPGYPWLHTEGDVLSATFSPDGSYILTQSDDGIRIIAVPTGQLHAFIPRLGELEYPFWHIPPGVFFPDGQQVMISGNSLEVHNISPYIFHSKNTMNLKFSALSAPHGRLLVSMDADGTLYLSKLDSIRFGGRPLPRDNPDALVHSVEFSPDERHISATCKDGTILLWRAEDLKLIGTYCDDLTHGQPSVSFSHDGTIIIVTTDTKEYYLKLVDDHLSLHEPDTVIRESSIIIHDPTATPHVYTHPPNRRLKSVRWFPDAANTAGDVLWAYIDNVLIRAGKDGKFIIVPLAGESKKH